MADYNPVHIDDLDDDEVLALSDEQIERLVKRRMAEEGIPVLAMPIEPEYLPVTGADQAVFQVAGLSFRDRDAAEQVLAVVNAHASSRVTGEYDYSTGNYDAKFVRADDSEQSVTTRMYYSQESFAASKDLIVENARRKADYDKANREYNQTQREAAGIRELIDKRIADVSEKRHRSEFLADRYQEYLSIAAGDALMAMQFLMKAHNLSDEEIAGLRERAS